MKKNFNKLISHSLSTYPCDRIVLRVNKNQSHLIEPHYYTGYCISRNFREKIFSQISLRQTFCEFLFSWIVQKELHKVEPIKGPINKLTIVIIHQSSAHFTA